MAEYRILLHPAALLELRSLDGSVRAVAAKQIAKLAKYPFLGDPLGNKHGYDLTGCRNMYADRKRIRIVYSIVEDLVLVKIIAIGRSADNEVYRDTDARTEW
jgi:mRNA interferase RelE/StbE